MRRTLVATLLLAVALAGCGSSSKPDAEGPNPTTPEPGSPRSKIAIVLDDKGLKLLDDPIREGSYLISFRDRRTNRPKTETSALHFTPPDDPSILFDIPNGAERMGAVFRGVTPYVAINGARKDFPTEGQFTVVAPE